MRREPLKIMVNAQPVSTTRLHPRWLLIAQTAWVLLVLVELGLLIAGTQARFRQPLPANCAVVECDALELTAADLVLIRAVGLADELFALLMPTLYFAWNLSFVVVALLIFWRRSDDWMALLLSATLATLGSVAFSSANDTLLLTYPAWSIITRPLETMAYVSLLVLLLIFPDGKFVPRWTSFTLVLPLIVLRIEPFGLAILAFIGYIGIVIYAQIYRYRRVSDPVQRQQTKWVVFGLMSIVAMMGIWLFATVTFPLDQPTVARAYFVAFGTPVIILSVGLLFPSCVAIAILRYRLWDIDVIIRRTLVYTVLTATLALVYFGSVVVLQGILRALSGQTSQIATVVSTLAIAALFVPLRRHVQAGIDRRFYRRKYDAEQILTSFSAAARNEVDLDKLAGTLLTVVEETLQPAQSSLWLRRAKNGGKSSKAV